MQCMSGGIVMMYLSRDLCNAVRSSANAAQDRIVPHLSISVIIFVMPQFVLCNINTADDGSKRNNSQNNFRTDFIL